MGNGGEKTSREIVKSACEALGPTCAEVTDTASQTAIERLADTDSDDPEFEGALQQAPQEAVEALQQAIAREPRSRGQRRDAQEYVKRTCQNATDSTSDT